MQSTHLETGPTGTRRAESRDGTTIGYQTLGEGPAVIVIPGVMSMAADYAAFARALAETFTVHTIERRGRGFSGPQGEHYGIARECEDVAAVQDRTGSQYLIGHSYGGLIALEAARNNKTLRKIAVYEPGVSVDGLISMRWVSGYERKLAERRPLDAFVEFCLAVGPERVQKTPSWAMKIGMLLFMRKEKRESMYRLLPANLLEHREVRRLDNTYENYREVAAPTLLMVGGRSGLEWVVPAITQLSRVLPVSELKTFPTLDHFGSDQRGPREIAQAVKAFFLA